MPLERRYVNADEVRRLFNEADYWGKTQTGELREQVVYDARPRRSSGQGTGTRSQRVIYTDQNGRQVATVHQYLKPDGSLGGSGRPDPKRVRIGNTLYLVSTNQIPAE
jgi:hypothetical protein